MAKTALKLPAYAQRVFDALRTDMPGADISVEKIRETRYRFVVIWEGFIDVPHPERQERVWNLVEQILKGPDLLKVAMIITMATDELYEE